MRCQPDCRHGDALAEQIDKALGAVNGKRTLAPDERCAVLQDEDAAMRRSLHITVRLEMRRMAAHPSADAGPAGGVALEAHAAQSAATPRR